MHIRNLILTIFTTFAAVLMLAVSLPVYSQELANQDTLAADDSLAVDTIMIKTPNWHTSFLQPMKFKEHRLSPAEEDYMETVKALNQKAKENSEGMKG